MRAGLMWPSCEAVQESFIPFPHFSMVPKPTPKPGPGALFVRFVKILEAASISIPTESKWEEPLTMAAWAQKFGEAKVHHS